MTKTFLDRLKDALHVRIKLLPDFLFVAAAGGAAVLLCNDQVEGVAILLTGWLIAAIWWAVVDHLYD